MVKCKCCSRGAAKAVGLSILTFCLGVLAGTFCPSSMLVAIELILLALLGYLCLFQF